MDCFRTDMLNFLKGSNGKEYKNVRMRIPFYQRRYSWTTENCNTLYSDLNGILGAEKEKHFLGSVVYFLPKDSNDDKEEDKEERYMVDGQQRVVTVMLLLFAIRDVAAKHSDMSLNFDDIKRDYLASNWNDLEYVVRLIPADDDKNVFRSLYYGKKENDGSNMVKNYMFFREKLEGAHERLREFFEAIGRLEMVAISLKPPEDDPQLVFASLNSTGMALSEGDKVRNYLLMGLEVTQQGELSQKYWGDIEKNTDRDISGFIRDYLTVKTSRISRTDSVYKDFNRYARTLRLEGESPMAFSDKILCDMEKFSEYYGKCRGTEKDEMGRQFRRLKRLDIGTVRPFFMKVLSRADAGEISEKDALEIFRITESYLFRRSVEDYQSRDLTRLFSTMDQTIYEFDYTASDYVDKYVYTLSEKADHRHGSYPRDDKFYKRLTEMDVYNHVGIRKYVLERFEDTLVGPKEDHFDEVNDRLDEKEEGKRYSIEHIMPQTLNADWRRSLGEDSCDEIHKKWLHRLANLTLTGYNSELQNYSFADKKKILAEKGNGIRMNDEIAKNDVWGEKQLEERSESLVRQAKDKKIWDIPESSYRPMFPDTVSRTYDYKAKYFDKMCIFRYRFLGAKYKCSDWSEMFENVIRKLHENDGAVLSGIVSGPEDATYPRKHVSSDPKAFGRPFKIDDGIYIERFNKTSEMIYLLQSLLKLYKVKSDELVFFVQEKRKRVKKVYEIIEESLMDSYAVFDCKYSVHGYTRYTTRFLDGGFFPDAGSETGNWIDAHHYFYEIVTDDGLNLYIKLEADMKNASPQFNDFCAKLYEKCQRSELKNRTWCEFYRTQSYEIGENIKEEEIQNALDECMKVVLAKEIELARFKGDLS